MNKIILASTSKYRKELLEKAGIPFEIQKPHFDEDLAKKKLIEQNATALEIAENLSKQKALSINNLNLLIISGDQVVSFNNKIIGKSGSFENAFKQLLEMNGKEHILITAITVQAGNEIDHLNHITKLKMKNLTHSEIENYLHLDQPYDCAGSYKIEKNGVCLFESIETNDFTAIQGLPMIWLTNILRKKGYELFKK